MEYEERLEEKGEKGKKISKENHKKEQVNEEGGR